MAQTAMFLCCLCLEGPGRKQGNIYTALKKKALVLTTIVAHLDYPQLPPSKLMSFALPLPLQPRRLTPALLCFSEPLSAISPLLKGSDVNASPSKGESGSELHPLLWSSWGPSDWPEHRWFPLPGTTSTPLNHHSSSPPHPEPPDLKSPPSSPLSTP